MLSDSLLPFPGAVKCPSPERRRTAPHRVGGPASYVLRPELVLRQARQTRNVVTVARRLGVRCNDVFLIVLDCLDERRAA